MPLTPHPVHMHIMTSLAPAQGQPEQPPQSPPIEPQQPPVRQQIPKRSIFCDGVKTYSKQRVRRSLESQVGFLVGSQKGLEEELRVVHVAPSF